MRLFLSFLLSLLLVVLNLNVKGQRTSPNLNLGMETTVPGQPQPDGWKIWGSEYLVEVDSTVAHSGKHALRMEPMTEEAPFGGMGRGFPNVYKGKTVELRGHLKTLNVKEGHAGLVLRLEDGESKVIAFDNMAETGLTGTNDWTQISTRLELPAETEKITIGVIFIGSGVVWVDDLEVLIDGKPLHKAKRR